MSKKNAILLILTVFIGFLAALIWFYFNANTPSANTNTIVTTGDVYDPFGLGNRGGSTSPATTTSEQPVVNTPVTQPLLRKISSDPVSGSIIFNSNARTDIRYILRANGNIYETYTDSTESKRISNTTIPKVYESNWLPNGQNLIIRYLKDVADVIQSFSVEIKIATTTGNEFEGGVDGMFLPENISQLAINPLGDKVFYLISDLNGSSGYITKTNGSNKKLLFQSPLIEWQVSWPKEDYITFTTKPSAKTIGYMYFLNTKTGSFDRVIGDIAGLTTNTNPTATKILYSDSSAGLPKIYLYDVKKAESKMLPWNTLPEKCAWDKNDDKNIYCAVPNQFGEGDYPDAWYQGLVSFTDSIWKYDQTTGATTQVANLKNLANLNIDATDLKISGAGDYMTFVNKTDLSFWGLKITP
ncbi:MAG: hypothetical protein WCO10_01790 [bacterium]